jgi:excisionase family DNA binding protein
MTRSNGSAEAKFENMATPSNTREQRFSIAEVAESIGISESMVRLLIKEHKLGCYQVGRRKIVSERQLQEYLALAERKARVKAVY